MEKEIERKFLCSKIPNELQDIEPDDIYQGILLNNGIDMHLRIRLINERKAYWCLKYAHNLDERDEYEYEIPYKDGRNLITIAYPTIEKVRYTYKYKDHTVYFDDFLNDGLYTAEIEFKTKKDADAFIDWPEYFIKEVTHINQYDLLDMYNKNKKI